LQKKNGDMFVGQRKCSRGGSQTPNGVIEKGKRTDTVERPRPNINQETKRQAARMPKEAGKKKRKDRKKKTNGRPTGVRTLYKACIAAKSTIKKTNQQLKEKIIKENRDSKCVTKYRTAGVVLGSSCGTGKIHCRETRLWGGALGGVKELACDGKRGGFLGWSIRKETPDDIAGDG